MVCESPPERFCAKANNKKWKTYNMKQGLKEKLGGSLALKNQTNVE